MSDVLEIQKQRAEAVRNEEAAKKDASLNNAIQMQAQFFQLRERFFVLYTDKFPMADMNENFELANGAATLDLKRRYSDSAALMALIGLKIQKPSVVKWLEGEPADA